MKLYFDLDTGVFCSSPGSRDTVSSLSLKRGDVLPIDLRFLRGISVQELAEGATGQIGIKASGNFDGGFLAVTGAWSKSGTGTETVYSFQLDLNTTEINDLLGVGAAADVASVTTMLELEFEVGGDRTSSNTVSAVIHNDVIRGDELSPTPLPDPIGSTAPSNPAWTARDSSRKWASIASSEDGTKLVAGVGQVGVGSGYLYTSTDSGATWTERGSFLTWRGVASSADGTKLVAVALNEKIYTSTDSGATWTARDSNRAWSGVASSADGTKLVAVVASGQIYTSTDSGATWTARGSNRIWSGVASSADGTKLVAVVSSGQIYTSTDSGATWTARDSNRAWSGVASSADGTKLVAVAANSADYIYTSTDNGATWTARDSQRNWAAVASSADGTKLVAVVVNGQIYTSTDSGGTWAAVASSRVWRAVTSSADGAKLAAAGQDEQIYTFDEGSATPVPPYIRVAGGFLYIQDAGVWKKAALSAL